MHVPLYGSHLVIVAGVVTLGTGLCGCCSTRRQSRSTLVSYALTLGLIVMAEVTLAVFLMLYVRQVRTLLPIVPSHVTF